MGRSRSTARCLPAYLGSASPPAPDGGADRPRDVPGRLATPDNINTNECLPRDAGHDAPERPRERHRHCGTEEHAARRHRLPGVTSRYAVHETNFDVVTRYSCDGASRRASRAPSSSARASRARTVPAGRRARCEYRDRHQCAAARRTARPSTINSGRSLPATRMRAASPSPKSGKRATSAAKVCTTRIAGAVRQRGF